MIFYVYHVLIDFLLFGITHTRYFLFFYVNNFIFFHLPSFHFLPPQSFLFVTLPSHMPIILFFTTIIASTIVGIVSTVSSDHHHHSYSLYLFSTFIFLFHLMRWFIFSHQLWQLNQHSANHISLLPRDSYLSKM